jgi:hypothetical protein
MRVSTKFKFEYLPLTLLILIFTLVAGSELYPAYRKHSWTFLFVAFAIISCASSYFSHKSSSFSKHFSLWVGAIAALMTVFVFEQAELINPSQMALFILVLLGFATFSSGLYGSISESGIGLLLLIYAVMMAMLEEYLWVVWIFILLLIIYQLVRFKKRDKSPGREEEKDL